MLTDFGIIFIFIVFGLIFVMVNILLSRFLVWFLDIGKFDRRKHSSYECGENPIGDARVRFNARFYLVALVFLIFDVEAIFLIPIAVVFGQTPALAFGGAGIFLLLLLVGLIYDWAHGDLNWVKPKPRFSGKDV